MNYFIHRICRLAESALGLDQLSANFKKFACMYCSYCLFQSLVSAYITTLLMRVAGNGDIVMWYNFSTCFFQGCGVVLGVVMMRKGSVNLTLRISILGFIALYSALLFYMASADKVMLLLGFLNGISNGFYWLTYAAYFSAFTEDRRRDVALGFMGFVNGVTILVMPALSGFLIETIGKKFGTFAGYIVVFGLSFAIAVVTILLSFRLPKQVGPVEEKKTYFCQALRTISKDACWRCGMACETLRGIRDGTFNFLLNLLLFEVIQSETLIGMNNLLASVGTIISFWVAGRIIRPENRVKSMFVGSIVLLAACGLPAISLNPVTIMIFAVVNAFFNTFVVNPSNGIMFLIVQKKAEPKMTNEYLSIRDVFLVGGRMIGIAVLLVFPKAQFGYVIAIVLLTLSQFVMVALSRRSTRLLKKLDESSDEATS